MPLIIVAFIALGIVLAILGALQAKKRREAFQALAQRLGLHYTKKDRAIPDQFRFLDKLRQGEGGRYAQNVLRGDYAGHPIHAFDYQYITRSRNSKGHTTTHHHHFSCFILEQENHFPELRIYPEGFFSKLGQALGFDDIDFESVEFSKAFVVKSKDKKFAYDICHTGMMEYLLNNRQLSLEIENQAVCISFSTRLKPEEIEGQLRKLVEVRELFPQYLYEA